ncbi:MAG TPA: tetratricopeptide repeat protein [Vicinamibacterales bacterium]|nr:tetratricopeptide repeat protein [Vicinamibacterales bacterium]
MNLRATFANAVLLVIVFCTACSSSPPSGTTAPSVTIRPVPRANMANAAAPVQQMLRDRYAAVDTAGTSATPDAMHARAYGELGMLLLGAEYFTEAEIALRDAETLAPGEMRWPYYLGLLYQKTGDPQKSAAAFERAVKADETYPPALTRLGNAYLDQGRPEAAEPLFNKALSRDPRLVAALFGLGRAALARKDYAGAIGNLERALTIDPDADAVHYALALAYRGAGQADKARAHLRAESSPVDPPDPVYEEVEVLLETPVAFELRGAQAMAQGHYDEAIDELRRGVALDPNEPALRHKLATALALEGNQAEALETMRETVRRSPTFAKGHYSLGLLYLQTGDFARAAAAFGKAIDVEPSYVEPRLQLAQLLRRTGQSMKALPHYVKLIELDPRVAEARFGYAMALVDLGRFREAVDQLTQGQQRFPQQPGFAIALARVLAASPDAQVRDGQRAIALLRAIPPPAQQTLDYGTAMAMTLAELGQFDDAAMWQQHVILNATAVDPALRRHLNESREAYLQHRSPRQPWIDGEPMELTGS